MPAKTLAFARNLARHNCDYVAWHTRNQAPDPLGPFPNWWWPPRAAELDLQRFLGRLIFGPRGTFGREVFDLTFTQRFAKRREQLVVALLFGVIALPVKLAVLDVHIPQ